MTTPEWKQYELLVANVQRELAPGSVVVHNDRIMGRNSQKPRQIDISIRGKVGQFEMLIVIDCKDHGDPIDVAEVGSFIDLVNDVGAHQGAMVAAAGFTDGARNRAKTAGVALYRLVDTDQHKWQATVYMPILCDLRCMRFSFRLSMSGPFPFRVSGDQREWIVRTKDGAAIGTAVELVEKKWEDGELPGEVGDNESLDFIGQQPYMDNGYGTIVPVSLTAGVHVTRRLFYGRLPIKEIRGLAEEGGDAVITRGFTTGPFSLELVEKEFQEVESEDKVPGKIGMRCQIHHSYGPLG